MKQGMGVMSAVVCVGRRGKGESTLLDSEAREGFMEKGIFERGLGECFRSRIHHVQRPRGGNKPGAFKKHTGDQMV